MWAVAVGASAIRPCVVISACCLFGGGCVWQPRMAVLAVAGYSWLQYLLFWLQVMEVMEDSSTACFGCNALQLTLCAQPCAITERVRSRGCSQIDKWLHHPLLHDQIVLVTSPMI